MIFITGNGKSGSWKIRGEQLGMAIGAKVAPRMAAESADTEDAVIIVKRPDMALVKQLQARGVRIIWDVVDAWPQPDGNLWNRGRCMSWLIEQMMLIKPHAMVAATNKMMEDIFDIDRAMPVLSLPHHSRPGLFPTSKLYPVKFVAYEGDPSYLGCWHELIYTECKNRGWEFVVNPHNYSDADVVICFREQRGYAAVEWKSGVKFANAAASGIPVIGIKDSGYAEIDIACGGYWVTDDTCFIDMGARKDYLRAAFDNISNRKTWLIYCKGMLMAAPNLRLETLAKQYKAWLRTVLHAC